MVKLLDHIMGNLALLPASAEVDINNVAMRLALDMTGVALGIPACRCGLQGFVAPWADPIAWQMRH